MDFIDTHAHLTDEKLCGELADVLARAQAVGVGRVICVSTGAADSREALAIANKYPDVFAAVGIHPNHASEARPDDWEQIALMAGDPRVVAIGETGLDRHWDFTPFPMQEDYFARHLALSRAAGKPIVIHTRDAEADVIRMLREEFERHGPVSGVLHSYTGPAEVALEAVTMGLHVSFAGMLTYKSAQSVRDCAVAIPPGRLLVETDSPYLAPEPVRGRRNEPANVVHTATRLAQVRGMTVDALAALTSANARRLFGLA